MIKHKLGYWALGIAFVGTQSNPQALFQEMRIFCADDPHYFFRACVLMLADRLVHGLMAKFLVLQLLVSVARRCIGMLYRPVPNCK
jgi:hypothetical protein